jgi:putative oxidoreductase
MRKDLGLLVLRVGIGAMMIYGHGWGKAAKILAGNFSFADPVGLGPAFSLILAGFAEFLCCLLLVLGIEVRWAAIPPFLTMAVAGLIHHAADPFATKEKALLYGVAFLAMIFLGGGKYSLDRVLRRKGGG